MSNNTDKTSSQKVPQQPASITNKISKPNVETLESKSVTKQPNLNTASTIDGLIKVIPTYKSKGPNNRGVMTIIVDLKSGELLEELPIFHSFGFQKYRFYEIDPNEALLNVKGPIVFASYPGSNEPFTLEVSFDIRIAEKGVFNLIRAVYEYNSPLEAINKAIQQRLTSFIFERTDFVKSYKRYEPELISLIIDSGKRMGVMLKPTIKHPFYNLPDAPEFFECLHTVMAKTKDGQDVELAHTLALTLVDDIKYRLKKIIDVDKWAKTKLEQFTKNALVEITYAEVLINLDQDKIKQPMQEAVEEIGYKIKQLIVLPGIDIEKFYFETDDNTPASVKEFSTADSRVKISLNVIVSGKLNLQHIGTKKFIKPGIDIIAGMKRLVQDSVRNFINGIAADEFYTRQSGFQENLKGEILKKLHEQYGFNEIEILVKLLENDLIKRLSLLQEKPYKVTVSGDWGSRSYDLWFKVVDVGEKGWYRFFANNYKEREDELSEIGRMVKNGIERVFLRAENNITQQMLIDTFTKIREYVIEDFGLIIKMYDFIENISDRESIFMGSQKNSNVEEFSRQQLINKAKTEELEHLIAQRNELLGQGEYRDESALKAVNEKIDAFMMDMEKEKGKFIALKTDHPLSQNSNQTSPLSDNNSTE